MVNMYKLRLTTLQQDILRLLFVKAGTTLNQNGMARFLKVSPPAIRKALPGLEKENFVRITQDKVSRRWAIELNRENRRVMQLKRADNLMQIYDSGLADFLEKEFAGGTIVLFGSYSRGEDIINSDIDLAVIGRKDKILDLSVYEIIFERTININCYPLFDKIDRHLKENLCNGIVLVGGFEL